MYQTSQQALNDYLKIELTFGVLQALWIVGGAVTYIIGKEDSGFLGGSVLKSRGQYVPWKVNITA